MYEEAIGFAIGDAVRDKDGILTLRYLLHWLYKENNTSIATSTTDANSTTNNASITATKGFGAKGYDGLLTNALESMYQRYGYFISLNGYFVISNVAKRNAVFERLVAMKKPLTKTSAESESTMKAKQS